MARTTPRAKDTKERIMSAALEAFAENGYHATSIDEVAKRAGATKGAVYYYFEDKDDLARDLHSALWERLRDHAMAEIDPEANTVDNLARGFEAFLTALGELNHARFFLNETWHLTSDSGPSEGRVDGYSFLRAFLEDGVARGEIADLDLDALAHVLVGMYAEATLYVLQTGERTPTADVIHRFIGALAPAGRASATRGAR